MVIVLGTIDSKQFAQMSHPKYRVRVQQAIGSLLTLFFNLMIFFSKMSHYSDPWKTVISMLFAVFSNPSSL